MIEVLKQLVDALENHSAIKHPQQIHYRDEAIEAGKKAIAELEKKKPMALPCCGYADANAVKWNSLNGVVQCHNCGQNYTTSQHTWVGLIDDEHCDIWYKESLDWMEYGKAIEAKLKQKNGFAEEKNT